jgi:hypothetical protein
MLGEGCGARVSGEGVCVGVIEYDGDDPVVEKYEVIDG